MTKRRPSPPWQTWLVPLALLAIFLAVRLPALGRFVTTDEALWLHRSANFYLAVTQGDWAATFQSPHPGVLTSWAGAIGFQLVFPQYAQVGSPEIHDSQLLQLMENHGVNPMEVLAAGRAVLVLVHAAAFIAAWPFAKRLLGTRAAALGLALVALDPFTIAHQRLLHLDGMLASLILLSILAYIDYLQYGSRAALAASALGAGLAWLTKTPSWFLLPAVVVFALYSAWRERGKSSPREVALWQAPLIWAALAALVFFAMFPAMWGAPLQIPAEMASYALGSAEGEYSGPVFFNGVVYADGELGPAGWIFYPLTFLWRSTPLVLLGLFCAAWFAIEGFKHRTKAKRKTGVPTSSPAPLLLFFFSLGFMLFMTLAGKKFDRYLLPAIPPLVLVAGWGWVRASERMRWLRDVAWRPAAMMLAVGGLQLASALATFPYYLTYYNPLLGGSARAPEVMMIGWGEGLDQAAGYLEQKVGIAESDVATWYSVSFNLMFTPAVADIPVALVLPPAELEALLAKEYLVIYIHQWQRGTPQNLLDALQGLEPEFRVEINGLDYVRVYHLDKLTRPRGDGVFQVGVHIAHGAWRATPLAAGDRCFWARRKYDGIQLGSYYGQDAGVIQIQPGDYEVEFVGCGTWEYLGGG